jgi:class 3 adenylate cyclase
MSAAASHKLAAILSADVAGYARLMAEDEDETVRRVSAYRTEVTNLVGEHGGRVVDFTGDKFRRRVPHGHRRRRGPTRRRNHTSSQLDSYGIA